MPNASMRFPARYPPPQLGEASRGPPSHWWWARLRAVAEWQPRRRARAGRPAVAVLEGFPLPSDVLVAKSAACRPVSVAARMAPAFGFPTGMSASRNARPLRFAARAARASAVRRVRSVAGLAFASAAGRTKSASALVAGVTHSAACRVPSGRANAMESATAVRRFSSTAVGRAVAAA